MTYAIPRIIGYTITYKSKNGSYALPKNLRRELEGIGGLKIRTEHGERPEICITLPTDLEKRVRSIKGIVKMERCPEYNLRLF